MKHEACLAAVVSNTPSGGNQSSHTTHLGSQHRHSSQQQLGETTKRGKGQLNETGTNFHRRVGQDQEIKLVNIHHKTENEKEWALIFCMRQYQPRQDCLISYVQDMTNTRLNSKFLTILRCEPTFTEEKI